METIITVELGQGSVFGSFPFLFLSHKQRHTHTHAATLIDIDMFEVPYYNQMFGYCKTLTVMLNGSGVKR